MDADAASTGRRPASSGSRRPVTVLVLRQFHDPDIVTVRAPEADRGR